MSMQGGHWSYSQSSVAWAVSSGSAKLVRQLIASGVSPNIPDSVGRHPIHVCCALTRENESFYARRTVNSSPSRKSKSLLSIDTILEILEVLIQNGAIINSQSISGRSVSDVIIYNL